MAQVGFHTFYIDPSLLSDLGDQDKKKIDLLIVRADIRIKLKPFVLPLELWVWAKLSEPSA